MEIITLSMAARAREVDDPDEVTWAFDLLKSKHPRQEGAPAQSPPPELTRVYRVTPKVISVLDNSKGFGHTDLVQC